MNILQKKWTSFIFVCFFFFALWGDAFAALQEIARLKEFSGEVMIKNAGTWSQPEKDLQLYSGAKIVTKQGTAMVLFNDGATMHVDVFSSIRAMDQMKKFTSVSDEPVRLRSIRIMMGRTKYEEQPAKGRKTQIELPTAVAALRGTGGWFGTDETGESLGKLYEGAMDTFGEFKEIVPKIMNLARAVNSPTWQASMTSSRASDNEALNIQEIQVELNTFIANTDPAIKASVQQTLSQIAAVLTGLETKQEKLQQAQQVKQNSENQIKNATDDTPQEVIEANTLSAQAVDTYAAATKESINADIVLILETLKGDTDGMATARQAKAQNDRALVVAGKATQTAGKAADLASTATNEIQRSTALAVAKSAANTLEAAASTIKTSNASVWLMARDDEAGKDKTENLSSMDSQSFATAEKTVLMADKAIEAAKTASTEQDAVLAQTLATSVEQSSKATQNALQVSTLAAQAVTEQNSEKATSLTQIAESAAQSVEAVSAAVDAIDQAFENKDIDSVKASGDILNKAVQNTQEKTQATIDSETADEEAEDEEAEDEEAVDEEAVDEEAVDEEAVDEEAVDNTPTDSTTAEPESIESEDSVSQTEADNISPVETQVSNQTESTLPEPETNPETFVPETVVPEIFIPETFVDDAEPASPI
ncbi:FecR domain-containing protein [Desulfobacula toluolica]|uniref:Uncharacterozed protein n=1 Tax=Desulfobacula toluolica (strain DSM 7467 / Tol2) TaxID=651182 RepID=K0NJ28_DESTT|nr:FecR domain-containing protein [Desulfobacula toluolica]CCK78937.1 uncharacterozed protein [Desulfobacula toluolica Tol2]